MKNRVNFGALAALFTTLLVLSACSSVPRLLDAALVAPRAVTAAGGEPAPMPGKSGSRTVTGEAPWEVTVGHINGRVGESLAISLPPGGQHHSVWGTYTYTGDSSIGTAAVHAGLITFQGGGTVTVEVLEGMDYYLGSEMNGVSSSNYGGFEQSFTFVQDGRRLYPEVYNTIAWDLTSDLFSEGSTVSLVLPPNGFDTNVWGTDVYTSDSGIGTAAVHAGLITFRDGGRVTIRRLPGRISYRGSTRNGVVTKAYAEYGSSFEFVK